jgi:DNA-binding IclR family transcriptional regulator
MSVGADGDASAGRPVGSVARALALLDVLAASDAGLGVNELARRIGVNASTASRLLSTLQQGGLVERIPGGPYRLGLRLVTLSDRVLAQLDVRERARPLLARLVSETGETATLSVPGGGEAITVDFVPSASSVVSMARVGRPSVPHATAAGKVMLAYTGHAHGRASRGQADADMTADPPSRAARRPAPESASHDSGPDAAAEALVAYTERTITDPLALAAELARVRERGYAEAVGEREPDLNALAAPVIGRAGELAAILGLQGPAARLPAGTRKALRRPLLDAAAELSRALGGPGADQLQG